MRVEQSVFLSENIKWEIMTGLRESWRSLKDLSYKRITLDECLYRMLWREVRLECQEAVLAMQEKHQGI